MSPNASSSDSAKAKLYHDLPLGDGDNIRVLDLQPGRAKDKLRGRLRVVSLSSKPDYEALSYAWGESTKGQKIGVNDAVNLPITDNLHQSLRRLRFLREVRTFWVDAICINQADDGERSQQVQRMGLIYENATS